ncbi:MAG TPA: polysaccharide deacetylase family protein [Candidatus Saccharimonadia bacterium]|nr:polysaccharide deacetylase family protein [Candidatus Saccharimonadia bacterium]
MILRWLRFAGVAGALLASAVVVVATWPHASVSLASSTSYPADLRMAYGRVVQSVHQFEGLQRDLHSQVVSEDELSRQLSVIQLDAESGHFAMAATDIRGLQQSLANWNFELSGKGSGTATAGGAMPAAGVGLPILLYHYPPANFEQQLEHLEQYGYTVIDLDQALAGLRGEALPPKPVVITFDDGFAAQTAAVDTLKRHHMKATFYIITGGAQSKWCIGAGRRYGDALQPRGGCGDAYLTWDQIRELDRGGLITIGGHTVNHRNLAALPAAEQQLEIADGKQQLEAQLGHAVKHFAYPYGTYNDTSIQIARAAGYLTAVTTQAGLMQPPGSNFTLRRERDALVLP